MANTTPESTRPSLEEFLDASLARRAANDNAAPTASDATLPSSRPPAAVGLRFNTGKAKLHLLPWSQLARLVLAANPERFSEALAVHAWAWRQKDAELPEVPLERLLGTVGVLDYGTRKYAPGNWTFGMAWMICVDCYLRHVTARSEFDAESGQPHLAHADTNLMFLHEYMLQGVGTDDRPRLNVGPGTEATWRVTATGGAK